MRVFIAIALAFLMQLAAFGQEAIVKSVVTETFDYSASKYKMTDLNGNTAALVIVRVLADNVEFKGNVLDGGVVHKTGEYWVYMGVGTKMFRIHSDKFLPVEIRFPDYGIPRLEAATTYSVTLLLPAATVAPPRSRKMKVASMSIDSYDVSAITNQRLDLNGFPCALVKVFMPAGAEFEGNIFGSVEFRDGEYWVYMSAGSKRLRIKHASAKPLEVIFSDYGLPERIEGKITYNLDITMPDEAQ